MKEYIYNDQTVKETDDLCICHATHKYALLHNRKWVVFQEDGSSVKELTRVRSRKLMLRLITDKD